MKKLVLALGNICVLLFSFHALAGSASGDHVGNANPGVIPPHAKPYGMTYGEWSAKWYQWLYSLPVDNHPLFDDTAPVDCSEGQTGKVWFLGGTYSFIEEGGVVIGEADRDCTIPTGTALFFPIFNAECNEIIDGTADEQELRECVNALAEYIQDLKVEIDGKEVEHLGLYRTDSPLFEFGPLPDNNILQDGGYDAPAGIEVHSVADGYYLMLAPLSAGDHTVHFEGGVVIGDFQLRLDIDYFVTVQPGLRN